jgi:F-type H+-transporting ATPase subunit b
MGGLRLDGSEVVMKRNWLTTVVVICLVALACPGIAAAAGESPDLLSPRFDLGIWTIVVFGLLFLVLKKFAWGPMLEGLQKREHSIRSAVEEAKLARAETERARTEFKAKLDEAYQEIPKIMEEARRDAQVLKEEMRAATQAEIQTERQRLRREIDMVRDQALQYLISFAAQLATLISTKAIRRSLTEEDHRRLVDEALAEMREMGKAG